MDQPSLLTELFLKLNETASLQQPLVLQIRRISRRPSPAACAPPVLGEETFDACAKL